MTHVAHITEIFQSLQGEGPHTGDPMTFVRFSKCRLGCRWCDTSHALCESQECRIGTVEGEDILIHNPITVTQLNDVLRSFSARVISVTGGEPLEQVDFLVEWLPSVNHWARILLETNGVLHDALKKVIDAVHIVSMDMKLPSSAGCRPLWSEHDAFLRSALAAGREVYVKIVVTERTSDKDLQEAIGLISKVNKYIPVIIQPAAPTLTFQEVISRQRLDSINRVCQAYLPNVSLGTQMHKEWGVQ